MKRCSKCKKIKDEGEFGKDRSRRDGLNVLCKKCAREQTRRFYRKDGRRVKKYYRYDESHRVVDGVREKRCRRCKKWRTESEFYRLRRAKDRLSMWCKECADKAIRKSRKRRLAVRS